MTAHVGRTGLFRVLAATRSPAEYLLGNETTGMAVDFAAPVPCMVIRGGGLDFHGDPFAKFSFSRASTAWYWNFAGLLSQAAVNGPRYDHDPTTGERRGLLIERQRTCLAKRSRRLDDASAWTLANVSASAVAGVDGVAGSATRLSATAANATCLGSTNTSASAARRFAPFVRRVAGTGGLEATLDAGATWTALTGITSSWQRLGIGATVANPRVGLRISTNGDSFDVDFANGETGSFDTSPIESAAAIATRAHDYPVIAASLFPAGTAAWTVIGCADLMQSASGNQIIWHLDNNSVNNRTAAYASFATWRSITIAAGVLVENIGGSGVAVDTPTKVAHAVALNNIGLAVNGVTFGPDTSAALPTGIVQLRLGNYSSTGGEIMTGHIRQITYLPRRLSAAELAARTT